MSWSAPKTWNTGDLLTAPDLDTYVRDNAMWIYGDLTIMALILGPAWSLFGNGYPVPQVVRHGSLCTIQGVVLNTSGASQASGSVIATLPGSEFIPPYIQRIGSEIGGAAASEVNVTSGGSATIQIQSGTCVASQYVDFYGSYSLI